jgi:hypothetical protein
MDQDLCVAAQHLTGGQNQCCQRFWFTLRFDAALVLPADRYRQLYMKTFYIIFFLLTSLTLLSQTQQDTIMSFHRPIRRNGVFAEILGNSYRGFSINYDRAFYSNKMFSFNGSIGGQLSKVTEGDDRNYFIPGLTARLTVTFYCIESGFGVSFFPPNGTFPVIIFGARYLNKKHGILIRATATPLIVISREDKEATRQYGIYPYCGFSIGYCFKSKK